MTSAVDEYFVQGLFYFFYYWNIGMLSWVSSDESTNKNEKFISTTVWRIVQFGGEGGSHLGKGQSALLSNENLSRMSPYNSSVEIDVLGRSRIIYT